MDADRKLSIGELADLASVSRRTIRYYVQRGLLAPPLGAGRGHYYTGGHLQRLLVIKLLQDRRLSLDEIEREAVPAPARAPAPPRERDTTPDLRLWTRIGIQDGVELHIEGGRYRLSPGRMLRLREAVRAIIGEPFPPEPDVHEGDDDHGQD